MASLAYRLVTLILACVMAPAVRAESSAIDLTSLSRRARAAVMLLIVMDESGRQLGSGTGFVVSGDGKFVTNRHVATAGPRMVAKAANGRRYNVLGVLAEDSEQDLVLLKIDGENLPTLPLGSSERITTGLPVAMIGNPLGMDGTATAGTVSGVPGSSGQRRLIEITAAESYEDGFKPKILRGDGLQVTTPVTYGSSGSPVLNAQGEVIGVITAAQGLAQSMAIPVEVVKGLLARATHASGPAPLAGMVKREKNQSDLSSDSDFALAIKAYESGDYTEAERRMKAVVARFPTSPTALVVLGQVYSREKSYNEATASYERALRLKSDLAPAWFGLAVACAQQGLYDRARDAVRELEKLDPTLARKLKEARPELRK
jgi:S1-C subfamily serine protease